MDTSQGSGSIEDENEQEIAFSLNTLQQPMSINDQVLFKIELSDRGLMAVEIKLI